MLDDSQAQGQQSVKSKVQAKCCFALETFCENLGDEIVPFLEPLMARCDRTRLRHGAARIAHVEETQGAVGAPGRQPLHVRDLASAQRASPVVQDRQHLWRGSVFHSNSFCARSL